MATTAAAASVASTPLHPQYGARREPRRSATPSPPGPTLQALNAALHREPFSTFFYGFFWSFFLLLSTPIAVFTLQLYMVVKILMWCFFPLMGLMKTSKRNLSDDEDDEEELELAVLITGCDTGFGKELAIWAATGSAGFTVFAGCRSEKSFEQFNDFKSSIIPLHMDVTKDQDVDMAVERVTNWITAAADAESSSSKKNKKKRRILHALINNAGIFFGLDIDLTTISDFQRTMDGKLVKSSLLGEYQTVGGRESSNEGGFGIWWLTLLIFAFLLVNFFGTVRCCKAFMPLLKDQALYKGSYKGSRILNIVSVAGLACCPVGFGSYCPSKHAAQAFSQCLRSELAAFGIQVTTINPTFHRTPIVTNARDTHQHYWNMLPEKSREEYGEEYFERYCEKLDEIAYRTMWKPDVVVEQVMDCLTTKKQLPMMVLVGTDAWLIVITRMLPGWVLDIVSWSIRRLPSPAAATVTTTTGSKS